MVRKLVLSSGEGFGSELDGYGDIDFDLRILLYYAIVKDNPYDEKICTILFSYFGLKGGKFR